MNPGILEAKEELEAGGLTVKLNGETSLWICDTIRETGGVRLSNDASALVRQDDRWIAVFPAEGMLSYEVPGDLPDVVSLIKGVYASYRRAGGPLKEAFARSVPDPERYLQGRLPAEDRTGPRPPARRVEVAGGFEG